MSRYCQTSVVSFNRVNNNWRTLVGPKGDRSRLIGGLLNLKFLFFYNYFGTLITGRLIEGGAKRTSLGGRLMGVQTPLSSVGAVEYPSDLLGDKASILSVRIVYGGIKIN